MANVPSFRSHAAMTSANRERGVQFLRYLYTEEQMESMWNSWGQDFEWLTKDIVYGMFYGDDTVLGNVETELITYTAIVSQGLQVTVKNHLRGLLGMGLSVEEIECVTECGKIVAKWSGMYSLNQIRPPLNPCPSTRVRPGVITPLLCPKPSCFPFVRRRLRSIH